MKMERYDRQMRFFGMDGQSKIAASRVAVVGAGGLGSHVIQQLALLGVGNVTIIDGQELAETDRNRYVIARQKDPIPGSRKVDLAERLVREINPEIAVQKIPKSLVSEEAFRTIIGADFVFGCLDSEGARLILNELCAAYARPYFDLASDIIPGDPPDYGGRVCVAWDGQGCIVCRGELDLAEAQEDLMGTSNRADRDRLYGVKKAMLGHSGPSVVSINGVVASLGVTEFMVAVTGIRTPKGLLMYRGQRGTVSLSNELPVLDCYYCRGLRGKRDIADVQRYIRAGVGEYLR